MKKKLLSVFLSLLTTSTLWAADGDTFTANTVEGVEMTFMVISESDKTCQVGDGWGNSSISPDTEGSITIPSEVNGYIVKEIREWAFCWCYGLTSVIIPEGVTSIGDYAFQYCGALTSINMPASVTSIGDYAFQYCGALTSINIPEGVTSMGDYAFSNCSGLTDITIQEGVTSIGNYAFEGCSALTSINIPEGVTSIGWYAFGECTSLTNITIPKSVTSIGLGAFKYCGLSNIIVESGNTAYDSRDNCNAIIETASNKLITGCKNTIIPASVTSIGYGAFSNCTGLTSITIPESVTSISESAFSGCSGLTSITIPEGVTSIGYSAFEGCTGLTSITIPEGVTSIGSYAFEGCTGLTSVTIPEGVTSIGDGAFGCCELSSIVVKSGNAVFDSRDNCNAIIKTGSNELILGCKNTIIPASVTCIGYGAFDGCTGLSSITIPKNVTSIDDYNPFYGCELSNIVVESGNTVYDSRDNCNAIIKTGSNELILGCKNTIIPASVTSIGNSAFGGCSGLISITIPNSVTSIGNYAFANCGNLKNVVILNEDTESIKSSYDVYGYDELYIGTLYVPQGTKDAYEWQWGSRFEKIIELADADVTLGKNVVSFASEQMLDFSTPIEDLKAYIVSGISSDGKAIINEVTGAVPSGTGLILKGTAGHSYAIPYTTTVPDAVSNMLVGVTEDTEIGGNDLDYILSDGKFVKASYGTLPAGKAYLKLDEALARSVITIGDEITGIKTIDGAPIAAERYYNLNGQRVSTPQKGLYIVNGKKVAKK